MRLKIKPDDKLSFLSEINRGDLANGSKEDFPPQLFELFLKQRKPLVKKLKDYKRSQMTKSAWRQNRWTYLHGIRKWHRSVAGKKFHRELGRFLVTRIFDPERSKLSLTNHEELAALSSVQTHFFIETGFYAPLTEEADLYLLIDYVRPMIARIVEKLCADVRSPLDEDEYECLLRCIDPAELARIINARYKIKTRDALKGIWKDDKLFDRTHALLEFLRQVNHRRKKESL